MVFNQSLRTVHREKFPRDGVQNLETEVLPTSGKIPECVNSVRVVPIIGKIQFQLTNPWN